MIHVSNDRITYAHNFLITRTRCRYSRVEDCGQPICGRRWNTFLNNYNILKEFFSFFLFFFSSSSPASTSTQSCPPFNPLQIRKLLASLIPRIISSFNIPSIYRFNSLSLLPPSRKIFRIFLGSILANLYFFDYRTFSFF